MIVFNVFMIDTLSPFCLGGNFLWLFFVFTLNIKYNICMFDVDKDNTMNTEVTTPEQYFFSRSRKRSHPNFKKMIAEAIDTIVLKDDSKSSRGNAYKHTKSGHREDLGIVLRSNWEANVARIYNAYEIEFEFEPKVFSYPVKRGTKGYTPDFYLPKHDEWLEVKGYLDDKSKIKLKRFKRYYPEEFSKLTFVCSKYSNNAKSFAQEIGIPQVVYYEEIKNYYMDKIPYWEGK
jgi:hypothetical protein